MCDTMCQLEKRTMITFGDFIVPCIWCPNRIYCHLVLYFMFAFFSRAKKWVVNMRREDLMKSSAEYLHVNIKVCSEHFEKSQYHPNSTRLKRDATPTLFDVPNPPKPHVSKRPLVFKQELPAKAPKKGMLSLKHANFKSVSCFWMVT